MHGSPILREIVDRVRWRARQFQFIAAAGRKALRRNVPHPAGVTAPAAVDLTETENTGRTVVLPDEAPLRASAHREATADR